MPEFGDVQIAYCDRQPLTPEEAEAMTYEIVSPVSVDSFGTATLSFFLRQT
jgi:hypothetical protein